MVNVNYVTKLDGEFNNATNFKGESKPPSGMDASERDDTCSRGCFSAGLSKPREKVCLAELNLNEKILKHKLKINSSS